MVAFFSTLFVFFSIGLIGFRPKLYRLNGLILRLKTCEKFSYVCVLRGSGDPITFISLKSCWFFFA